MAVVDSVGVEETHGAAEAKVHNYFFEEMEKVYSC